MTAQNMRLNIALDDKTPGSKGVQYAIREGEISDQSRGKQSDAADLNPSGRSVADVFATEKAGFSFRRSHVKLGTWNVRSIYDGTGDSYQKTSKLQH